MFGQIFYFDTIKKYIILVGTLMNDIRIYRTDTSGVDTALIRVPVMYAPKDKMLARVVQDPDITRQTATATLPLISFEMGQIKYAADRKINTVGKIAYKTSTASASNTTTANSATIFNYQYNPVPYNFDFKVYIYAKNAEDGTKILEQILPYFTPDWCTTVKLIPEMEEVKDIFVVLKNVEYQDTYSGDFKERRAIIWTLDLELKGYLYGPIKQAPIINTLISNFYIADDGLLTEANGAVVYGLNGAVGNTNVIQTITLTPGLDANGNPTSNASVTIPPDEIEATDNYGAIYEVTSDVK